MARKPFLFIYHCVTFCQKQSSTSLASHKMQPQTQLFSHFSKRRLLDQVISDSMREMFRQEIKYSFKVFHPNFYVYLFKSDIHFNF